MRPDLDHRPLYRVPAPHGVGHCGAALVFAFGSGPSLSPAGRRSSAVFGVSGELCPYSVPLLQPALAELASGITDLTLDVEGVTFLGAAGLHLFVELDRELDARGGHLFVRRPSPMARRVMVIAGLEQLLTQLRHRRAPRAHRAVSETGASWTIRNLDGGHIIEVTVEGELDREAIVELKARLLDLVTVRQPAKLHLRLDERTAASTGPDEWVEPATALADFGGTLRLLPA